MSAEEAPAQEAAPDGSQTNRREAPGETRRHCFCRNRLCTAVWRQVTCIDRGIAVLLRNLCYLRLPLPLTGVAAEQTRGLRLPLLGFLCGMLVMTVAGSWTMILLSRQVLACVRWPVVYVMCAMEKVFSLVTMPPAYMVVAGFVIMLLSLVAILKRVELAQRLFSGREGATLEAVIARLCRQPHTCPPAGHECVICCNTVEEAGVDGLWRQLPCGHTFHEHCLLQWLARSHRCPLCRYDLHQSYASE